MYLYVEDGLILEVDGSPYVVCVIVVVEDVLARILERVDCRHLSMICGIVSSHPMFSTSSINLKI